MSDASVGKHDWSLSLAVPIVAEGDEKGWTAYVDVNGSKRIKAQGKTWNEALKALKAKLEKYLNEHLFW